MRLTGSIATSSRWWLLFCVRSVCCDAMADWPSGSCWGKSFALRGSAGAVPSRACGKTGCAGRGLAGSQDFKTVAQFIASGFVPGHGPLLVCREPVSAQTLLRKLSDGMSEQQRMFQRLARLDQTIDQTHLQRFFSRNAAAGQDEIQRVAVSDEPRQTYGPQVDQRNAESATVDAKHCIVRGHAKIAPQRQFQSTGNCMPFHGGDDRFAQKHPGRSHRPEAFWFDRRAAAFGDLA